MNRAFCLRLADAIEAERFIAFDMNSLLVDRPGCRTAGCIAGTAVAIVGFPTRAEAEACNISVGELAMGLMGLDRDTANALFFCYGWEIPELDCPFGRIGKAEAAAAIRKLVATGWVDWSHVRGARPRALNDDDDVPARAVA